MASVRQRRKEPLAATERYWIDRFTPAPPPLDLPLDHPRLPKRSFRAERRSTAIPDSLIAAARKFSAAQHCTLFTTMLGAFHVLLHRLSGQDDIVVGIAAAGQTAMGSYSVVGHCLNFLPIRSRPDAAQSFAEFLGGLKTDVLDTFDHQHFTLGALLPHLALPRDASRPPLVSVTFNIDRAAPALRFAGVDAEFDVAAKSRLAFELSFNLLETDRGWRLYCVFNRDLFEGATIERWLAHYLTLLGAVTADAATPLAHIPLQDAPARSEILAWSRGAQNPFPHDQPVHAVFSEVAALRPDAIAFSDSKGIFRYREVERSANQVANHLLACGLKPGGIVGLSGERSARFLWEALGVLRAGGAYLPIASDEAPDRLAVMRGKAAILLVDPWTYCSASDASVSLRVDPAGPAYLLFTSGSTGTPKGVLIPHRAITRLVCNTDYAPLAPDDVVSFQSNLSFDAATFEMWGALLNGARLELTTRDHLLDAAALARHYRDNGVTTAFVTTALFNRLVRAKPDLFRTLRHVLFGGERCDPAAVALAVEHGKPEHLLHVYGPTETTTFATCHRVERAEGAVPIGRPIANTDVFILDAALEPAPVGVVGEIFIGGPGLAIGYDDDALTAQRFAETPFGRLYRTGDLARWLPGGEIDILGRSDRQIKMRGFRIEPGEIEAALRAVPSIGECVVTPRGESLVAYFTANSGEPPSATSLREALARSLPAWMMPSAFVRLPQLPFTSNGKLDLSALPAPGEKTTARSDGQPETTLHVELIALWQSTLGDKPIGIHDDFFALGGHSLLAAQMLTAVEQQFGIRVPYSAIFERATIAHLATQLVAERRRSAAESPLLAIRKSGSRAPIFFLHGDFTGGGFFCRDLGRHLGEDRPFYALHPHGLHGEPPPATIEAMAAKRLAEVRRVRPRGPYVLGGFCNGALVAYEMARQLATEGERVEALVMIGADGSNFRYRHVHRLARVVSDFARDDDGARASRFRAWRQKAMDVEAWGRSQMLRLRAATSDPAHVPRRIGEILRGSQSSAKTIADFPPLPAPEAAANPAVVHAYTDAIDAYVPAPFGGRVILVWSEDDPPPNGGITYGWESVCADLHAITVPGDHHSSIALEENLRELAARLRPLLDRTS